MLFVSSPERLEYRWLGYGRDPPAHFSEGNGPAVQWNGHAPVVLLVEDDTVDIMAVERALRRVKPAASVHVAHDGAQGLAILKGVTGEEPVPFPDLVLLDLQMPRMGGLEFLEALRASSDPSLRDLPVVVLTHSDLDEDRRAADALGVTGFITKTTDTQRLADILDWLLSR